MDALALTNNYSALIAVICNPELTIDKSMAIFGLHEMPKEKYSQAMIDDLVELRKTHKPGEFYAIVAAKYNMKYATAYRLVKDLVDVNHIR